MSGVATTTSNQTLSTDGVNQFPTPPATATDIAGIKNEVTGNYEVIYAWSGFLQPINDTAHQVDKSVSIFEAGSAIPAKFELTAGVAISAVVTEDAFALTAMTGTRRVDPRGGKP